ncbi:hypothetical protein ACWGI8_27050 [Streptomyces sp. NPDC054841]
MGRVHQAAAEEALAELAASSANFGFLLPLEPLLLLYGAGAEADAHARPERSLAQARQFAEVLTAESARMLGPESAGGAADGPVHRALTELRRSGDPAPGGEAGPDDRSRARRLVRHCFDLGVWYFRLRTGVRDALSFVPSAEWDDAPAGSPHRQVPMWEPVTGLATWVALLDEYVPVLRRTFDRRTPAETATRVSLKARSALLEAEWGVTDLLTEAGWTVRDDSDAPHEIPVRGVAVRGAAQPDRAAGPDYVLRVDGRPVGTVEVRPRGEDLRASMARTREAGTRSTASAERRMPYTYATDGVRVLFQNGDDPSRAPGRSSASTSRTPWPAGCGRPWPIPRRRRSRAAFAAVFRTPPTSPSSSQTCCGSKSECSTRTPTDGPRRSPRIPPRAAVEPAGCSPRTCSASGANSTNTRRT